LLSLQFDPYVALLLHLSAQSLNTSGFSRNGPPPINTITICAALILGPAVLWSRPQLVHGRRRRRHDGRTPAGKVDNAVVDQCGRFAELCSVCLQFVNLSCFFAFSYFLSMALIFTVCPATGTRTAAFLPLCQNLLLCCRPRTAQPRRWAERAVYPKWENNKRPRLLLWTC
jgi:hypothetical protein